MTISIARRMVRCGKPTCTACPHGPYYHALVTFDDRPPVDAAKLETGLQEGGIGRNVRIAQRKRGNWLLAIELNQDAVESRDREELKDVLLDMLE